MEEAITIFPADLYVVSNRTILQEFDKKVLLSFYEPIIGHVAVSLYLTLWNDLEQTKQLSRELTHHHLMSLLRCSLKIIKEAREALEAVGLVKTFVKTGGNVNYYLYELYSPLAPNEFFSHPILNVVLYNNIGAIEYELLQKQYQKVRYDTKDYMEITKKMDDVFESTSSIPKADAIERVTSEISVKEKIDFDLILASIPKGVINEKAFNKKTKELINSLAFLYKIDTLKMTELIRVVLNEYGMVDKNNLRLQARKYYQFNNSALPTIIYRTQPEYLKSPAGDNSMRGKIIQIFENVNPVDFLRGKYHGGKPTNRDIKLIEKLMIDLELPPAVVNVLIDYCLKKNNNQLATSYVETIAGQWKRADLKTAAEAMEFAEKEHKRMSKKEPAKVVKKEPVWFNKNIEEEKVSDAEAKELEDLFKEFN